jgi:hypothetical protein
LNPENLSADAKDSIQWARIEVGLDIHKTWTQIRTSSAAGQEVSSIRAFERMMSGTPQ